jgi:hypothetical protein
MSKEHRIKEIRNPECPDCGHIHPSGIGVSMCLCDTCALIWFDKPELLTKENKDKYNKIWEKP